MDMVRKEEDIKNKEYLSNTLTSDHIEESILWNWNSNVKFLCDVWQSNKVESYKYCCQSEVELKLQSFHVCLLFCI